MQNYKTLYNQAVNKNFPGYIGGFDRFRNYARLYTPQDHDIVCPNNDTPYSWAWLDLRAEPLVLTLPDDLSGRYYVNQWFDMYTHNFAYTGVRTTGNRAGNYLFVGPDWHGSVPENISKVFRSETWIIGTLTRTQLLGADDVADLKKFQQQYRLTPLSKFTGSAAPASASDIIWPVWDEKKALGSGFIHYLNFLLPFMPTVVSEKGMFQRFAKIGIEPGAEFNYNELSSARQQLLAQACKEAFEELRDEAKKITETDDLFGSRQELGSDYIRKRAIGAMIGIYANTKTEAVYRAWSLDKSGNYLDGNKKWVLRFDSGKLPPVSLFWSITLYNAPEKQLVANSLKRYSLGGKSKGLQFQPDGALEIYIQHERPEGAKIANWLPAPAGRFVLAGRMYGPLPPLLNGEWKLPLLQQVE